MKKNFDEFASLPVPNIVTGQRVPEERLKRARELRDEMTPSEKRLWACLHANRLAGLHFRRQQVISGYFVDFYCHAAGVVVEVDGDVHIGQEAYDEDRDQTLAGKGLLVLRFTNQQIWHQLNDVLQQIAKTCRERTG